MLLGTDKYVFQMLHECILMKQKEFHRLWFILKHYIADYNYVSDWSLYVSVVCMVFYGFSHLL